MSFLSRGSGEKGGRRVFVLGLDGVPFSFLAKAFAAGLMPNLGRLAAGSRMSRMTSAIPTVSSVAWATYMTGKNPGKHGIYGFVDRKEGTYDVFVPTAVDLVGPALWDILGAAGRKVIVVNVPMTYPPRPVNGIVVADFLCTSIDKVAWPPGISAWLKDFGYRIDADAKTARIAPAAFLEDVRLTLDKRFGAAFRLMDEHPWDFFQLHVMETDRMNHFFWPSAGVPAKGDFADFYRRLDAWVGEAVRRVPPGTLLVLMSDHGFCPIRKEVYLNQYLVERGLLTLPPGAGLAGMGRESVAYSLIPGRVYVNLEGREPRGGVAASGYEAARERIAAALLEMVDPEGGARVVGEVLRGEDVFRGGGRPPYAAAPGQRVHPPDLVAVPADGYDLKGNLGKGIYGRSELTGMHTWGDAFLMVAGEGRGWDGVPGIADVAPSILAWAGLPVPGDMDGRALGF